MSTVDEIDLSGVTAAQRPRIAAILHAVERFRRDEVDVALELFDTACAASATALDPLREPHVPAHRTIDADYTFVGATLRGALAGFACYGPTPATDGTYDLYWIVVHPSYQGSGCGSVLIAEVERRLQTQQGRMLVVETSSRSDYAASRRFYTRRGYVEAGRVRDFYAPADDRIIFTKQFHSAPPGHGAVSA